MNAGGLLPLLSFAAWIVLWALGGWWIARRVFTLARGEEALVGISVGLVLETLAANLLGQALPTTAAFWLAAAVVFAAGLAANLGRPLKKWLAVPAQPGKWLLLAILIGVFYFIGRGLAIFDDFAHLPTVSMMAAGDLPPHFPLDPAVRYDYHYFLLLFAAQITRIAGFLPWKALDLARALSFSLALMLTYVWVARLAQSRVAGLMGTFIAAFASGTRWILLFLPPGLIQRVSDRLTLIGSGVQSGPELTQALTNVWMMEGGGPQPFLFAFANGLQSPGVISLLGPNGMAGRMLLVTLLLTFNRWRSRWAILVSMLLVSANGLLTETAVLLTAAAWGLVTLGSMLGRPGKGWSKLKGGMPRSLWGWLVVAAGGTIIGFLQGGALHGMLRLKASEMLLGEELASYQTVNFHLVWPPEIVSAHLGSMSLADPYQALAALAELGPLLIALPWVAVWGWRAFRAGRWFEAVTIFSGLISLPLLLMQFSGSTGVRNTGRLYTFLSITELFAVAAVWRWAARRKQWVRFGMLGLAFVAMVSGLAMFSVQLVAAGRPVTTYFIQPPDVRAMEDYWDRLEPDAMVFDPTPSRGPTVFGRGQDAGTSWYASKEGWLALAAKPDLRKMAAAGFDYLYYDEIYVDELPFRDRAPLDDPCGVLVQEYTGPLGQYRRLVDLRGCK